MQYHAIEPAVFLARPNRFIALIERGGETLRVHVKNTGRCAELLTPGCRVYLEKAENPARKTPYDLVAVEKATPQGTLLINMDSAAPNLAAAEWLRAGGLGELSLLRPEYRLGDSRFDFYGEYPDGRRLLVEVKGCTLEQDGVARFPDAPTLRGLKHIRELTELAAQGWVCAAVIIIQMKGVRVFRPNWDTQPDFGLALCKAQQAGVRILALDCTVTPDSCTVNQPVFVDLSTPY